MDAQIEESVAIAFLSSFLVTCAGIILACDQLLIEVELMSDCAQTANDIGKIREVIARHSERYKYASNSIELLRKRVLQ